MNITFSRFSLVSALCGFLCAVVFSAGLARGEDAKEDGKKESAITLADGKMTMKAPAAWVRKQPATRIVEHEFAAPKVEGDAADGRVTVMGAGGSIEANIGRWVAQFTQPDGSDTRDKAVIKQMQINGQDVHYVDLSGTFKDQAGPFTPAVSRDGYRMLGAIIVSDKLGQYFVKLYGPAKTVGANEKAFNEMLQSLAVDKSE